MSSATIKCTQCGHENEPERIYCHNCGAKLDRSVVPTSTTATETPQDAAKRVKKLTNPASGFFVGAGKSFLVSLIWAVTIATLVQIARPPDGIPAMPSKDALVETPPVLMAIQTAQTSRTAQQISITEDQINQYLQGTLKPQATGLIGDEVKFIRAYVHCEPGVIWIWSQQSLFDYPLYGAVGYRLSMGDKVVNAKCAGGYFGRLPVHPAAMEYSDVIFSKLYDALKREHKTMNDMQAIEVRKGQIIVTTKPAV